ncbi:eIF2A-related protein [Limnoraphis robusta]|uniref:NACHT domain-containing protein n=1 Tax=Limnoraphis robusta CCNP1315 TaxID=3110306 RepID=A0ABU5U361_9CYAN|nr:NACHT domain-containing protein [Limnoraphis robusta]MEA5521627.1 NACHT domain-containing protein [Limnoraphis robusta CCNP1315]MEA5545189.1 NACHT domain-containing protein [Limnoraphis robusta CCNP1324]
MSQQLRSWFKALKYDFEPHNISGKNYFEWIVNIPARRGFDRVLIRGVEREAGLDDLQALRQSVDTQKTDEGWLVTHRRISRAARDEVEKNENRDLFCYTFDELLDEVADFNGYLNWLEQQVKSRKIDEMYVPLACRKEEIDPQTKQRIGMSLYDEREGWIEGYIDIWLDDPAKEHLSVLGEFGTGKTWFAFHYAWIALKKYLDAKKRRVERPRIPIVIPLRDYAKAVSVESLFSEFFFRKHEIKIPGYSAFEQLNRMGKLLLIFDGFDEMAARVDRQAMINNFWELAKVVVPGSKAILTCRTEHFPEAKEGRSLLNAELKASTANLTGETPQFEMLELEKFNDEQIRQVLSFRTNSETVDEVMGNPQLLDLARRPVMVDLILAALPDIEAGKPVDISRVYLYAVQHKMERDITNERTFTSLADKLYFLCELAWEMLSTEQMSLNYRSFPDQIRRIFSAEVQEQKDLDHWDYDMRGQTLLIRNSDGDYMPAHRSLLEFFVAYKLLAELGVLADDFVEVAKQSRWINTQLTAQNYTWQTYFKRQSNETIAPLNTFDPEPLDILSDRLRHAPLTKAVLDFAIPMLNPNNVRERLLNLIQATRGQTESEVGYWPGNLLKLLTRYSSHSLEYSDLSNTVIKNVNFSNISLRGTNFTETMLTNCIFNRSLTTVFSVAFSPDGKFLAVGDSRGIVQVWEATAGRVLLVLQGHLSGVNSVAFSLDGKTLASGSYDRTIKLWRLSDGNCIRILEEHSDRVYSVAFSPNRKILASGSNDNTVKLWSLNNFTCLATLKGHSHGIRSIAFSPDGKTLASGSLDNTIKLWSLNDDNCFKTLEGHLSVVYSVAFSPDGKTLASGSLDNTIKLWSLNDGNCFKTLEGHSNQVYSVAFAPNGQTFATGGDDTTIKLWSLNDGNCLKTLEGHLSVVYSVAFSPNGETLASGSRDHIVKLWKMIDDRCFATLAGHSTPIDSVAFSPDGQTFASGSRDNTIKLWRLSDSYCFITLKEHSDLLYSVTFSPDGQTLASCSRDKTIKLWSLDGHCFKTLKGHSDGVRCVAFSPNGQILASGSFDNTIKLWSLDGHCLMTLKEHSDWVNSVAFSPDGNILASGSFDNTIKLWRLEDGHCLMTLEEHLDLVNSVVFSPNGKTLASCSDDHTIKLWRLEDGRCIKILAGHSNWVNSVAFSPDGKTLASGSSDNTIKLWRFSDGHCIQTLEGHSFRVKSVAFSSDSKTLVSGSWDETVRLWDVETGECLRVISDKIYSGLNLAGVKGLTHVEIATLKALGAVDTLPQSSNSTGENL